MAHFALRGAARLLMWHNHSKCLPRRVRDHYILVWWLRQRHTKAQSIAQRQQRICKQRKQSLSSFEPLNPRLPQTAFHSSDMSTCLFQGASGALITQDIVLAAAARQIVLNAQLVSYRAHNKGATANPAPIRRHVTSTVLITFARPVQVGSVESTNVGRHKENG